MTISRAGCRAKHRAGQRSARMVCSAEDPRRGQCTLDRQRQRQQAHQQGSDQPGHAVTVPQADGCVGAAVRAQRAAPPGLASSRAARSHWGGMESREGTHGRIATGDRMAFRRVQSPTAFRRKSIVVAHDPLAKSVEPAMASPDDPAPGLRRRKASRDASLQWPVDDLSNATIAACKQELNRPPHRSPLTLRPPGHNASTRPAARAQRAEGGRAFTSASTAAPRRPKARG